ncbi:hypothetical protein G7046_g3136 [Stylonectria norvegica]|nr:hypothetical protein G7046_g3136 [Stylonectria norvegica]
MKLSTAITAALTAVSLSTARNIPKQLKHDTVAGDGPGHQSPHFHEHARRYIFESERPAPKFDPKTATPYQLQWDRLFGYKIAKYNKTKGDFDFDVDVLPKPPKRPLTLYELRTNSRIATFNRTKGEWDFRGSLGVSRKNYYNYDKFGNGKLVIKHKNSTNHSDNSDKPDENNKNDKNDTNGKNDKNVKNVKGEENVKINEVNKSYNNEDDWSSENDKAEKSPEELKRLNEVLEELKQRVSVPSKAEAGAVDKNKQQKAGDVDKNKQQKPDAVDKNKQQKTKEGPQSKTKNSSPEVSDHRPSMWT